MNERIREIEKQCWSHRIGGALVDGHLHFDTKKFAELIVRECLLCCERTISDPVPKSVDTFEQGGIHCRDKIKEHFGLDGMSTEDKKTLIKELLGVRNE